jgi:glycosyltransferase involved in cell wall biosynthesis
LKKQTIEDWECIIIDDNSSDNSLEIINKLTLNDNRFLIISEKTNRGACYCRNNGVESSLGEYILFLDSDDIISINCLENRLAIINENIDLDFLVFNTGTFYKKVGDSKKVWNDFKGNHLNRFLSHDLPWVICSLIWKKSFLRNIGCFNESLVRLQDVDLHTRALLSKNVNYSINNSDNPDSFYRIDNNRISNLKDFLINDITGKIEFIKSMNQIGLSGNKYLKGTFFECFNLIFISFKKNNISKTRHYTNSGTSYAN